MIRNKYGAIFSHKELQNIAIEVDSIKEELNWLDPHLEKCRFNKHLARLNELKYALESSIKVFKRTMNGMELIKGGKHG